MLPLLLAFITVAYALPPSPPGSSPCSPAEFRCGDGRCIPASWHCDGKMDCSDNVDETQDCNKTCNADEFKCKNTDWCIQNSWVCDGDKDCSDNSDELDCPTSKCAENYFECSDKHCISMGWRCDGEYDCPDESDEEGCPNQHLKSGVCRNSEYECSDRITCIPKSWLCDGGTDCPGHEDEDPENCGGVKTCRADEFQCMNQYQCISGRNYCNGIADCLDRSDEINCTVELTPSCKEDEFDCDGETCIASNKVCDGKSDCPNGKDEPFGICRVNECLINNGGCSDICTDTPTGYQCSCKPGYSLTANHTCQDINECENPGACSHKCINENGTFECECFQGYLKDPYDRTRCKPTEGPTYLVFTRRHDIRKLSPDQHKMTAIVNNTKSATALDFIFKSGMIFWSDFNKIYKAPIDEGHMQTVIISNEVTNCDGLAIDWIYDHIYWTDASKNTIEVANLDGSMKKTVITEGLDEPRSIAVNPLDGWMYWSDWGEEGKIERGGMDGSHRHTIVSYDCKWPNGLTLDLVRQRLYWVDAKLNTISTVNFNGSDRTLILKSRETLRHPFSISVFEDYVYWTDWEKQTIFRANKFNGGNITTLTAGKKIQSLMVVHVYHPYRQPNGTNFCSTTDAKCSHLCLPTPQIHVDAPKISCVCPDGLTLKNDGLECIHQEKSSSPFQEDSHLTKPVSEVQISPISQDPSSRMVVPIVVLSVSLFLVFTSALAYIIYRNYLRKNITSTNFDNPVYHRTTEDRFSLQKIHPQSGCVQNNITEAQESFTRSGKSVH